MMSLLIPLLLFCILLLLNRQRAGGRQLPSTKSWRSEALEAAIERVEAAARAEPGPPTPIEPALPTDRDTRLARYLLDGDDARPRALDRVARLQRAMRGPGVCSPRRPS